MKLADLRVSKSFKVGGHSSFEGFVDCFNLFNTSVVLMRVTTNGPNYYKPLSTGGLDAGLVFGGSRTVLHGRVSNIFRPSDVAGVYGAAGAGLAVGRGVRGIVLSNQKGAVLELSGEQIGLLANVDLSGLAITMR